MSENSSDSESSCGWTILNNEPEDDRSPDDTVCVATTSDDSDIATLEVPKAEDIGAQDHAVAVDEDAEDAEDLNLGSSWSSQYTFSQPETVFPPGQSTDESSNDEVSDSSDPTPRKRRAKRRTVSGSESEIRAPAVEAVPLQKAPSAELSSNLNRCIVLALLMAISMGFGHFYGTIQIREHQKYVEKIHADELNEMKDDLYQCQKEQDTSIEADDSVTCSAVCGAEKLSFEGQSENLASENVHLRQSLGEEMFEPLEQDLAKQLKPTNLEEEGTDIESIVTENKKLKELLEGERLFVHKVLKQKETLLTETQMLRNVLDKERLSTKALRDELEEYSIAQSLNNADAEIMLKADKEMEAMEERLKELQKKLTFEQQRSDLWERLYIEARDNSKRKDNPKNHKKSKPSFFGSVKDTFDAMKNSTKEFVKHHKEKIKQAKQAVKEKLRKFSDSVKSTFRRFKDSTNFMFGGHPNKRKGASYGKESTYAKQDFSDFQENRHADHSKTAGRNAEYTQTEFKESSHFERFEQHKPSGKCTHGHDCDPSQHSNPQGCYGVFECAHQESFRIFKKVLDPIKADEFTYLIQSYLQQEVEDFHHWRELEQFISMFFRNGMFIHDQMLFTDFVKELEQYLGDIEQYKRASAEPFDDLDEFVYAYFFGDTYSTPYGPSRPDARQPFKNTKGPVHEKRRQKPHQRPCNKREGKWHRDGRANGRHMANLEIELGPLPFDPKY
ncbi:cell cycle progression protein 1 isoform X2 [Ambystoma mexicanum]|uniref:cell cycle progression protein 1 isoform X2 n=1 Tax=Ambystoma mexicanum TaxID=8296 RepID=UPI0037E8F8B4